MEYFKKAHVPKTKHARKEFKPKEKTKQQLKLYGFKHNDNLIIKNSAIVEDETENSSSVSGFSDLNLTNSSQDGESILESIDNCLAMNKTSDVSSLDSNDTSGDKSFVEEVNNMCLEENNSFDACKNVFDLQSGSIESSNVTFDSIVSAPSSSSNELTSPDTKSEESEIFDADGDLASKILNKLHHKKGSKSTTITTTTLGRNLVIPEKVDKDISLSQHGPLRNNYVCFTKEIPSNNYTKPMNDDESKKLFNSNTFLESTLGDTSELPSSFVSLSASDIPSYGLNDVLGEYRHSTIKNLPSCSLHNFGSYYNDILNEVEVENIDVPSEFETNSLNLKPDEVIELDVDDEEIPTQELEDSVENPIKVYNNINNVVIVMYHPCEIYMNGKVKLEMLSGVVQICGYTAKEKLCNIYAPHYNYAQCIKTTESDCIVNGLFVRLTKCGLTVSEAKEIVDTISSNDAVFCLHPLKENKIDFVENKNNADLFNKLNRNIDAVFKKSSEILNSSLYLSKPLKSFEENDSWKQVVDCGLKPKSRGIVCGGKGTGKSTFLRYYVNRLLSQGPVVVIDLDPGQCEFTVAGNVSVNVITEPLLGPNFTHLRSPELMLNIAMINIMDNLKRYTEAIKQLITHCTENPELKTMPWIVNTMGLCNTIGLKLICLTILLLEPTFVVQINSKNPKKRFDCFLTEQSISVLRNKYQKDPLFRNILLSNLDYHLFVVSNEDSTIRNFSLPPRDERYLNYLAYFAELLDKHHSTNFLEIVPYKVDIKSLSIFTNVKVKEEAITKVLNGKIIALCHQVTQQDMLGVFTLSDKPLLCLGYGLIRGIDSENGLVYVSTPLPSRQLASVRCLVYADWVPELLGPERCAGAPVPYRTAPDYQQRQLMFAPRRRFNPLLLLKMSRSPKLKA